MMTLVLNIPQIAVVVCWYNLELVQVSHSIVPRTGLALSNRRKIRKQVLRKRTVRQAQFHKVEMVYLLYS
jgi:hypothetical protein